MQRFLYIQSPLSLHPLAEACLTLTPKIYCLSPEELYLELSQTEQLFGGEAALLYRFEHLVELFTQELRQANRPVLKLVLTDRPEWCRPLATDIPLFLPPKQGERAFQALPLERLLEIGDPTSRERESSSRRAMVTFLKKMGLTQIREFAELPVSALLKRFSKVGVALQTWVKGEREWALPLWQPTESLVESIDTDSIESLTELLFYIRQVLVRLECRLKGRGLIARQLRLTFYLESGKKLEKILDLAAPLQEAHQFLKLLKDYLNGMEWDSPLSSLRVEISDADKWEPGQSLLFEDRSDNFHDIAQYVTRLRASLGKEAVGSPELLSSYLPERSWQVAWPPKVASPEIEYPERPLILLSPPKPWNPSPRSKLHRSENLLCEWWDTGGRRQYFITNSPENERLWVYLDEESQKWFIHGLFD